MATVVLAFTLSFAGITEVEAKRFGGGKSFGSKNSYSSPYRRASKSQPQRNAQQQKAYKHNQAARDRFSKRGGLMGLLGGLALGGLLGSLFFGGAFEGMNFMDILIFGSIAYLLYRVFAARRGQTQTAGYQRQSYTNFERDDDYQSSSQPSYQQRSGFDTDVMFDSDKATSKTSDSFQQPAQDSSFDQRDLPEGFDEWDFLAGAENAFKILQKAWDDGDLASIRSMTTDKVFADIQQQLADNREANHTDILKLSSELLEARAHGNDMEAVVLFDAIMREDTQQQAEQIREIWHFVKTRNSLQPGWQLDGIQQLED